MFLLLLLLLLLLNKINELIFILILCSVPVGFTYTLCSWLLSLVCKCVHTQRSITRKKSSRLIPAERSVESAVRSVADLRLPQLKCVRGQVIFRSTGCWEKGPSSVKFQRAVYPGRWDLVHTWETFFLHYSWSLMHQVEVKGYWLYNVTYS